MNAAIQTLLKIQALEFSDAQDSNSPVQIQELRTQVPAQILGHYDRLRIRGKKGVALVRNQSCHPIATHPRYIAYHSPYSNCIAKLRDWAYATPV